MKSTKKLVLAGLVLLASVMVLVGCKNDSVPETPKYTVTFETEHRTAPASITVESGTKLTIEQLQALPDTEDNIFEGWYDGKTQAKGGEYTVTKDVTLVAGWRNRDTVASVTFDPPSTKFYYDETVSVTLTSADEGATIKYHLGDENWQTYSEEITIDSDTTITAYATKAGLKNSAETTATYTVRKLTGISITPPTRTVYSEGEKFDSNGMVVTAEYDDGEKRTVEGEIISESNFTETAGVKEITVKYSEGVVEKSLTLKVGVIGEATYKFTETPQKLSNYSSSSAPTTGTWTYVNFGDWPQTRKSDDVMVYTEITLTRGGLDFFVGTDGNYYVQAGNDYYKVEPIVWRVLTEDYKVPGENGELQSTGRALLLAEKILICGIYYSGYDVKRTIGGVEIFPNNYEHSQIRAFLNGLSYEYKESYSTDQITKDEYKDAGFLQTAFTEGAQSLIAGAVVDNSAASTSDAEQDLSEATDYACDNTEDKIFLLSKQEATTEEYGFAVSDEYVGDSKGTTTSTRIRVTTDYAKTTGTDHGRAGFGSGFGSSWWLRSPFFVDESRACGIYIDGDAWYSSIDVDYDTGGVVPALSISLQ